MNDKSDERADLRASSPTMTLNEVAQFLSVHPITIYRLVKKDVHLGQFKVGRVWRFGREDLVRFAGLDRPPA